LSTSIPNKAPSDIWNTVMPTIGPRKREGADSPMYITLYGIKRPLDIPNRMRPAYSPPRDVTPIIMEMARKPKAQASQRPNRRLTRVPRAYTITEEMMLPRFIRLWINRWTLVLML
jgi:hypothetical protein